MPTFTTNYNFNKPLVNNATDADLWGGQLNTNFDSLDTLLFGGLSKFTTEGTIASATTTDLGTVTTSNIISITGTTTITSFGSSASTTNPLYFVRFTGILTLTHNGTSLILPAGANITTAAGDAAILKYEGSGNWRCLNFNKQSSTYIAMGSDAEGDIIYRTTTGYTRLAKGTALQQLRMNAGATIPEWATVSAGLTLGTPVATTSGTSVPLTGIPSTVNQITVMLNGVSTNGSSRVMLQIGDSGGIETTGYIGNGGYSTNGAEVSTGFPISDGMASGDTIFGTFTLTRYNGNEWICASSFYQKGSNKFINGGGSKTLSATLDRVSLTTVGGTDTFDAGGYNVAYI
jgi:hypothetical protein